MVKINAHNNNFEDKNKGKEEKEKKERSLERTRIGQAMGRLMEESFWDPWGPRGLDLLPGFLGRRLTFPKVDVVESDHEVKVTAEVPGVNPEELELEVEDDRLVIKGEVTDEKEEKGNDRNYYRYERSHGSFLRQVPLPSRVKVEEVKANCRNGVLTVVLPKAEPRKNKKIEIDF